MASKRDAAREDLVKRLVAALGDGCRPLGMLFAELGAPLDKGAIGALPKDVAVLTSNLRGSTRAELATVYACPRSAVQEAFGRDEVLHDLLVRLAIRGKTRAHTLSQLVAGVAAGDRPAVRRALDDRTKQRRWPPGVGAVSGRAGPLVFLMQDVASGTPGVSSGGPTPEAHHDDAPAAPVPFAQAFDAAFDRLRGDRGLNLVPLAGLRAALGVPRDTFDRELYTLRRVNRVVLHTFDGRHGKLGADDEAAAIEEDGRRFVYAARREA